jgi:hypothetical protein
MAYERRPGQGTLFRNRDKGDNEKAPNLKGTALLELADGSLVDLEIAAWSRESEKAGKWLSLSIKLKGARYARKPSDQGQNTNGRQQFNQRVQQMGMDIDGPVEDPDSDIPF